jgi:hypothetical protein
VIDTRPVVQLALFALSVAAVLKVWLRNLHQLYAGEVADHAGKNRRMGMRPAS